MASIPGKTIVAAGALALGVLGAAAPAQAQQPGAGRHRYQARIAGATVHFQTSHDDGAGRTGYEYDITFPNATGFYYVEDGLTARSLAQAANALMFRAARQTFPGATSAHKNGVWLVTGTKGGLCSVVAGTYWQRVSFLAMTTATSCQAATQAMLLAFGGVSAVVGRHSAVGLPWPATAPAVPVSAPPAPPTPPQPAPTATPQPAPAAPAQQYLTQMHSTYNAESDVFTTSGPFDISWDAAVQDTTYGDTGFFGLVLYSAAGQYLDLIANTTSSGSADYREYADCSGGCYLKAETDNMTYDVTVQ